MGYILKTNNRKKLSGTTLKAKIVSPDKEGVAYKEYPIEVQIQTLSNRECVLRDMQQIDAVLSQNNDWSNITTEIKELSTVIKTGANGSQVQLQKFERTEDNKGNLIIDEHGNILRQPAYSTSDDDNNVIATLKIKIWKGNLIENPKEYAEEMYVRNFVVPAYNGDSIITAISSVLGDNSNFWELIKKNNMFASKIFSDLNKINITELFNTVIPNSNGRKVKDMFDADDNNAKPQLTMTYPNYYNDPLITETANNVTVNKLSASAMYNLSNEVEDNKNKYQIEEVRITNLREEEIKALFNVQDVRTISKLGEVIAYKMNYLLPLNDGVNDIDPNTIKCSFSLKDVELKAERTVSDVCFISNLINVDDVCNNISKAAKVGWFIPDYNRYNDLNSGASLSDGSTNVTNAGNRMRIAVPENVNIVLKVSGTLLDMLGNTYDILDDASIGYSYDHETKTLKGFADGMITSEIIIDNGPDMHKSIRAVTYDGDYSTADDPLTTNKSYSAGSIDGTRYLYLDSTEFASLEGSSLSGHIVISTKENALAPLTANSKSATTFYFEFVHA